MSRCLNCRKSLNKGRGYYCSKNCTAEYNQKKRGMKLLQNPFGYMNSLPEAPTKPPSNNIKVSVNKIVRSDSLLRVTGKELRELRLRCGDAINIQVEIIRRQGEN